MFALVSLSSAFEEAWHWLLANGGILTSLIAGLFGVFTAHKSGRWWTLMAVAGVFGGMAWALLSSNYADEQQKRQLAGVVQQVDSYVHDEGQEMVSQIAQLVGAGSKVAAGATPQEALALGTAAIEANKLVANVTPERRNALTIWVFPHAQSEVNYTVVRSRLQQLAINVQTPPRTYEQSALTNSVWYGGGATLDEAKDAALIVTSAGLQIRQVCPATLTVKNLIQVGGSTKASGLPVLSPAAIQGMQSPVCADASEGRQ
jgi:hypothetical protein